MKNQITTEFDPDDLKFEQTWFRGQKNSHPKQVIVSVQTGEIVVPIMTKGNISAVIGKPKSRKTTFVKLLAASILKAQQSGKFIIDSPPKEDEEILYWFDTEQGIGHVQKLSEDLQKLSGFTDAYSNLFVQFFRLRMLNTQDRLKWILWVIENLYRKPHFVVIDGLRDLVEDVNDGTEANKVLQSLNAAAEKLNTHILLVLHQNKIDGNARGHLGTELTHKAETVISIEKSIQSPKHSKVKCAFSRDKEFQPFAFTVDDEGLPSIVEGLIGEQPTNKTGSSQVPFEVTRSVLNNVFKTEDLYSYNKLLDAVHGYLLKTQYSRGKSRVRELISTWENLGFIRNTTPHSVKHLYCLPKKL